METPEPKGFGEWEVFDCDFCGAKGVEVNRNCECRECARKIEEAREFEAMFD